MSMDYESIREEAKDSGRRISEMLALTVSSDPFYARMPSRVRDAEWFADVWQLLGEPVGAHLRRIHYQVISQPTPILRPDGSPYENTEECWMLLNSGSRNARYLELVDPTAFEDHRSPMPHLYVRSRLIEGPDWSIGDSYGRPSLPSLDLWQIELPATLETPSASVNGYDYDLADQPYHLEVWIEKSTMTDVLDPVCHRFGVNLVVGVGYLSITRIVEMLQRVAEHGKPARIFYISDFDSSGEGMPVQVARQSEFFIPRMAPGADLKLEPLALTAAQVRRYSLPRTPIKEGHSARESFEGRHGEGAVELDALEALYPGDLARLLREAIDPYIDVDLPSRLRRAEREASETVSAAWAAATEDEHDELSEIEDQAEQIIAPYREEIDALAARFNEEMAPLQARLDDVWQAITEKATSLAVQLPDRPVSDLEPLDSEDDWLFDSSRDYLEQLDAYQERRPTNGPSLVSYTITCASCGATTEVDRSNILVCSDACRKTLRRQREGERRSGPEPRPCEVCTTFFTPVRNNARICSDRCRQTASTQARTERRSAVPRGERPSRFPSRPCDTCEATFVPQRGNVRFCSTRCRAKDQRQARAERRKAAS